MLLLLLLGVVNTIIKRSTSGDFRWWLCAYINNRKWEATEERFLSTQHAATVIHIAVHDGVRWWWSKRTRRTFFSEFLEHNFSLLFPCIYLYVYWREYISGSRCVTHGSMKKIKWRSDMDVNNKSPSRGKNINLPHLNIWYKMTNRRANCNS